MKITIEDGENSQVIDDAEGTVVLYMKDNTVKVAGRMHMDKIMAMLGPQIIAAMTRKFSGGMPS